MNVLTVPKFLLSECQELSDENHFPTALSVLLVLS
jgi:hypothetical protein